MKWAHKTEVKIPTDSTTLGAFMTIPAKPVGLVIFSHDSGISRFSSRNNFLADELNKQHIATLLIDLLTVEEDQVYDNRFEISMLTRRLVIITHWASEHPQLKGLPIGFFGASTGAAYAINAAAFLQNDIKAVVSRGGRTDLAKENALLLIKAKVLLIAGSLDTPVVDLNKETFYKLRCNKNMIIVNEASHLFEEPGKLQQVAQLATNWFLKSFMQPVTQYNIHTI
jgi:putative phosphoribosyl transferase